MVTGPTRLAPVRVTVTRSVRPGSPGRPSTTVPVAAANWNVPADSLSWIVSVAGFVAPIDAFTGALSVRPTVRLPATTPSSNVVTVNVRLSTPVGKVRVPLAGV